jgi:hypothetical protein
MQATWSHLTLELLERGWTARDGQLHAPHEMMSIAAVEDSPNLVSLRDRMAATADRVEPFIAASADHAALHADLASLVAALDAILPAAPIAYEPVYAVAN